MGRGSSSTLYVNKKNNLDKGFHLSLVIKIIAKQVNSKTDITRIL